jgi:hypothetical protein
MERELERLAVMEAWRIAEGDPCPQREMSWFVQKLLKVG